MERSRFGNGYRCRLRYRLRYRSRGWCREHGLRRLYQIRCCGTDRLDRLGLMRGELRAEPGKDRLATLRRIYRARQGIACRRGSRRLRYYRLGFLFTGCRLGRCRRVPERIAWHRLCGKRWGRRKRLRRWRRSSRNRFGSRSGGCRLRGRGGRRRRRNRLHRRRTARRCHVLRERADVRLRIGRSYERVGGLQGTDSVIGHVLLILHANAPRVRGAACIS